ncbi:uncharacterized protein LOC112340938 [Selaginella moellendorffii]|uniref:uncharacterized protein LOC112340938 n=1 Tax=Selaginella moellendorffii TaxID=88036 RepID=UPI000D1C7ABF|nr:uncharacterized protein LOC112340938 [Selaginella moellendorffii]XP_024515966.1 uncharacterized protein LOC112340938 [Selaginella moellendorffii]|eukprot:XP_024515964.1 uncharacterized protein LOC112340938 [Selaginella moellendorffii]
MFFSFSLLPVRMLVKCVPSQRFLAFLKSPRVPICCSTNQRGFTSLPKPLSEFGRDLAEAVRDEAAEKHRAVKDRAPSEGSIANFRVFTMGSSLAFVWKSPGLHLSLSCLESLASKGIEFRKEGRRAYTLRS